MNYATMQVMAVAETLPEDFQEELLYMDIRAAADEMISAGLTLGQVRDGLAETADTRLRSREAAVPTALA